MNSPPEPDAVGVGACLSDPGSSVQRLLARAGRLEEIQSAIHAWAGEPLASSLKIANERDGTLVVYATSAAALTQVRYKQQELIQFLRQRLGLALKKVEVKVDLSSGSG
jgi:hypothetical protein